MLFHLLSKFEFLDLEEKAQSESQAWASASNSDQLA